LILFPPFFSENLLIPWMVSHPNVDKTILPQVTKSVKKKFGLCQAQIEMSGF